MKFITASLLICATATITTLGAADDDVSTKGKGNGPPFFLIDSSDQLCLAGEEFKRCSIDTLFFVVGSPGKFFKFSTKNTTRKIVIRMHAGVVATFILTALS
jgi:hypothetical protein